MSNFIEHNLSIDLLGNIQRKKLTQEGYSEQPCGACRGRGKVDYDGRKATCPSCGGKGKKWRPGVIVRK